MNKREEVAITIAADKRNGYGGDAAEDQAREKREGVDETELPHMQSMAGS